MRALQVWMFVACVVPTVVVACGGPQVPVQSSDKPLEGTNTSTPPAPTVTANDKPGDRLGTKPDDELIDKGIKRGQRQATNCGGVSAKGPFGDAVVHVLVKPNGDMDADVDAPFKGTPIGECLAHSFDREKVPPWSGAPVKKDIPIKVVKSNDAIPDLPASATTSTPTKPPK